MTERFEVQAPYDLALSLKLSDRFAPQPRTDATIFHTAVKVEGLSVAMGVRQLQNDPPVLEITVTDEAAPGALRPVATWMLFGELDLGQFYRLVEQHTVLGHVVRHLNGLKPSRPPSLFEMAVTAVTEQQISMAAAHQIRSRVVETFGDPVQGAPEGQGIYMSNSFPTPESLALASLKELEDCGLSQRKAEYIKGLAESIVQGKVDLERLKELSDQEVRSAVTELHGFGPWSADYILMRGLGRLDCVPADDLGVRTVVGRYLGNGSRMTAQQVRETMAAFEPYRGLVAFYLLAYSRMGFRSDAIPGS